MPVRNPVAAGRFYSGEPAGLLAEVDQYLPKNACLQKKPWGFMLPHAGYIYSGEVAGKTVAGAELSSSLIILCPNHTGRGAILGVWPNGAWITPLGEVRVDPLLAEEIISCNGGFTADVHSHLGEHSIEVLLPFIQAIRPDARIVPVCVGTRDRQTLERAGRALARVLARPENAEVQLIVSSDMNHYEDEQRTLQKDAAALEQALKADPAGLLAVTEQYNISMCGAAPLALALYAANALGKLKAELVAHSTSANASGDYGHVVGYAGMRFYLN